MQNFTAAQISNVTLTGDVVNQFEIVTVNPATGVTTIRAKENVELRTGSGQTKVKQQVITIPVKVIR